MKAKDFTKHLLNELSNGAEAIGEQIEELKQIIVPEKPKAKSLSLYDHELMQIHGLLGQVLGLMGRVIETAHFDTENICEDCLEGKEAKKEVNKSA